MTVSISIASGKGGVGKTNCAVNLSLALCKQGKKVVLFDTDFGMANAHILLGTNPRNSAASFLKGEAKLDDILTEAQQILKFIAGGSGLLELLNLNNETRYRMLQSLSSLEDQIDYLIVDTPQVLQIQRCFLPARQIFRLLSRWQNLLASRCLCAD